MTAIQIIVKEAKKLKKQYPKKYKTWTEYVKQASVIYNKKNKAKSSTVKKKKAISGVKKKAKKTSEKSILNKIHRVKNEVNKLDEAQHKHMSLGKLKSYGIGSLKIKYGTLSAKKLTEKSKRAKTKIQKELREIATKIKKLNKL
jgi:hypothetical protein